jgi:arginase
LVRVDVIGIPFNGDGTPPEEENPAAGLRQAGLIHLLRSGTDVVDRGDLPIPRAENRRDPETQILNLRAWRATSRESAQAVEALLGDGKDSFLLVLGGDCSILVGIFGAFALRGSRVGLVLLDGHTDFRAPEASESGEPADLELAILTGHGSGAVDDLFGRRPLLQERDVIVYGFREPDQIAPSAIRTCDRDRMAAQGMERSVDEGFAWLAPEIPLWLHLDVDVLDPSLMPVNFPEPGGLTFEDVEALLSHWLVSGRVLGLSVACYHPRLDYGGKAGRQLATLVARSVLALPACLKDKEMQE